MSSLSHHELIVFLGLINILILKFNRHNKNTFARHNIELFHCYWSLFSFSSQIEEVLHNFSSLKGIPAFTGYGQFV